MPVNVVIQSLWVHGQLSPMEQLCIRSFLAHGHEFHLYTYDSLRGVPDGTRVMDAREILPKERVFLQQRSGFGAGSYGNFSDFFRYQLLWERGGWWVDTDVVCLKQFDFHEPRAVATRWEPRDADPVVDCAIKVPAEDPLMEYCLEFCNRLKMETVAYGKVGAILLDRAIHDSGLEGMTVPWTTFCPIGYRDVTELTRRPGRPSMRGIKRVLRRHPPPRVPRESFAVHLWNEMWRRNGMDKSATYHRLSPYEQLKARYLAGR